MTMTNPVPVPVFGIELRLIVADDDLQPRVSTDHNISQEYGLAMAKGDQFPPLDVFYDGEVYWLADGFHRFHGAQALGLPFIDCRVHEGSRDDALWFTCGANATNGLRRTRNDVQLAIRRALLHPNGAGKSDRQIADHVACTNKTVAPIRRELVASEEIPQIEEREVTRGGSTYSMKTSGINAARTGDPDQELEESAESSLPSDPPPDLPEPTHGSPEPDPEPVQMDIEDVPGVRPPNVSPLIDPKWQHLPEHFRAIVRAHGSLPEPRIAAENFPEVVAHALTLEDVEHIAAWWEGFLPLWRKRQPEIERYQARIRKAGKQ